MHRTIGITGYIGLLTVTKSVTLSVWQDASRRGLGDCTPCYIFNPRVFYIFSPVGGRLTLPFPQFLVTSICNKNAFKTMYFLLENSVGWVGDTPSHNTPPTDFA